MLELHGFKCAVLCDNKPLHSYDASVADRAVSGWIASEVGKEFMIRIEQPQIGVFVRPHYTIRIEIDGREVDYMCVGPDEYTVKGIRPTPTTFATLRFAALKTTDEGSVDEKASADLGTIRVKISRVIRTGVGQLSTVVRSAPAAATVHERNKKHVLGGQSVSTGPVVSIPPVNTVTILPYSTSDPTPYVVFVFKYRSRAFLEAQEIIPREKVKVRPPPPPSPASSSATAVSSSAAHATSRNARKRARGGSNRDSTLGFDEEEEDVKPSLKRMRMSADLERRRRELENELRNIDAALGHSERGAPMDTLIDLTADDDDDMPPPPPRRRVKREPLQTPLRITEDGIIDLT